MNYFELYPGDYLRDTAELTLAEHGAFLLLLSAYYATERPIPSDNPTLFRLVRAMTIDEQNAVIRVIELFFPISTVDGLRHNKRADEEIVKARARIDAARDNGRLGGRPKKPRNNPVGFDQITQQEPAGVPSSKAPHTPHAIKDQELSTANAVEGEIYDFAQPQSAKVNGHKRELVPVQQIVELYHDSLPTLRRVEKITKTRTGYIRQRWLEDLPTLDAWKNYFADVAASRFLMGKMPGSDGRPPFRADLEWLCRPGNFTKVAEGKFHQ